MTRAHRRIPGTLMAVVALAATATPVYADDCNNTVLDCYPNLTVALLAALALLLLIALVWGMLVFGWGLAVPALLGQIGADIAMVAGDAMWLAGMGETDLGAGALGVEANGAMAVGDMGEGALAAEAESAGAADGGSTYVLGHGPDRMVYEGLDGYKVLNVPNWTPALNDAWVDSGIHENASFLLTSPVGPETLVGQAEFDYETIYLREIAQLFDAGYTPFVDAAGNVWMLPPGA